MNDTFAGHASAAQRGVDRRDLHLDFTLFGNEVDVLAALEPAELRHVVNEIE